jgi:hypothetical protein
MRTDESSDCRISASKEILNRGYGRSVATTQLAGWDGGPLSVDFLQSMSDEELDVLAARFTDLIARNEASKPGGG